MTVEVTFVDRSVKRYYIATTCPLTALAKAAWLAGQGARLYRILDTEA
jgi:hypothetical protein